MEKIIKDIFKYESYLFDMDGTLADSEKLKGESLVKTCHSAGGVSSLANYKEVMGESWETVRDYFYEISKIEISFEKFDESFQTYYKELVSAKVEATVGAINFIEVLKSKNKKLGLVTSSRRWMTDDILTNINSIGLFDAIVTKEDVLNHKPAPDAYLLAVKWLNTNVESTVIFEDSIAGIKAGRNAGCDVVAIKHDFNSSQNFNTASMIIEDFNVLINNQ